MCRTAQPHTEMLQQTLSQLQPPTMACPQPPELLCPLQDVAHSLYPLVGCTAKHARFSLRLGHTKVKSRHKPQSRGTCKCVRGAVTGLQTELVFSSFSDLFTMLRAALSRWLCPDRCLQLCWARLATHSIIVWRLDSPKIN